MMQGLLRGFGADLFALHVTSASARKAARKKHSIPMGLYQGSSTR